MPFKHFGMKLSSLSSRLEQQVSNAPLITFRLLFGALMLFSTLRFWSLGWIEDHFLDNKVQFKYYGFEWVELLSPVGMYTLHALMLFGALGIFWGALYRISAITFFISFTYVELIDLTYYLNHYYFVSLVAFLLIFLPAHRRCSIDAWCFPALRSRYTARWTILLLQFQVGVVYFYAGLAKLNPDWLLRALPLKIWLPAHTSLPLIGKVLGWKWVAYVFSWLGMLYDLTIVGWLSWRRTRWLAYGSVVVFHVLTGLLFQIGVFPLVMMAVTWIYFSPRFHERILEKIEIGVATYRRLIPFPERALFHLANTQVSAVIRMDTHLSKSTSQSKRLVDSPTLSPNLPNAANRLSIAARWSLLTIFVAFQLLFPLRSYAYAGDVFWTEQGYRFSWRVMLMEKAGTTTFFVTDPNTGREGIVNNGEYLCAHQEKQMAFQPDMILQFAHFLADEYTSVDGRRPRVRCEAYVTLNGAPSRLLIDPQINLSAVNDGWQPKTWILK